MVRRNNCYILERHFSVCGIMESSKDIVQYCRSVTKNWLR